MAVKWKRLWKWFVYSFGLMISSVLLVMLNGMLGITALLVGTIGTLIVSVMKLTCLYRTAKIFREYATGEQQITGEQKDENVCKTLTKISVISDCI